MNLLALLLGHRWPSCPPPVRRPYTPPRPPSPAPVVTAATALEVSKAARQLQFLDKAYGLRLWDTDQHRIDWTHDIELMRAADDLDRIALQLLSSAGTVCGEYRIAFQRPGQRASSAKVDSGGIEMPVIDRHQIAGKRVIVDRRGHPESYVAHLSLNWGPAPVLQQAPGDRYDSEHAAKITGGRETGSFFVSSAARHNLVITNASEKGAYCFARSTELGLDGIFVMRKHAPDLTFERGVRFTALIAQTPRGLQCRAARKAA